MQGSLINRYYISPKVSNCPSYSVNICMYLELMTCYFELLYFLGSATLAINHILVQKGLNVEFELGVIIN